MEHLARQAADRIELLRLEREDIEPALLDDLYEANTASELVELYDDAHRLEQALKLLKASIARRAGQLLDGEALEWGDSIVEYKSTWTRKLIDDIHRQAFVEWLGDDYARVVSMPITGGLKTALQVLCAERGVDYSTIHSTFFKTVEWAPRLVITPLEVLNG